MSTASSRRFNIYFITITGVMAALACVSNLIRIPFLDSKISVSNAVCVVSGMILGPSAGFLSAGLGNFLYDIFTGYGYESLITLVSKGAIALVAGLLTASLRRKPKLEKDDYFRLFLAALAGALTYVVLYMLKTFILGLTVNGMTMDGTLAKMIAKLPASLINAAFATLVSPFFYAAVIPALRHTGVYSKI